MDEQQGESPASRNEDESPESKKPQQTQHLLGTPASSQLFLWPPEAPAPSPAPPSAPGESAPTPPPSPDPPWSLADLFAFVLFAAISFIFANLVAISVFSALQHRFSWQVTMEQAFTNTSLVVSMQTGWELLWLLFIYFTVSKIYHRRFWQALKWAPGPRPVVTYLVAGAGLALVAQLLFNLFPSEKHLPIEKLFSSPESGYLLAFFGVCVAPFVEELVFRGFFYPVFERRWGLMAAVLLTALLFALIHVPQLSGGWVEITGIFFVGVVFSYCRGKTGSLLPPFLMHLAYNAALFVSLYFSTDRFRSLKG